MYLKNILPDELQRNEDLSRRGTLIVYLSILMVLVGAFLTAVVCVKTGPKSLLIYAVIFFTLTAAIPLWILNSHRSIVFAGNSLIASFYLCLTCLELVSSGQSLLKSHWGVILPLLAIFLAGRISGLVWLFLILAQVPVWTFLSSYGFDVAAVWALPDLMSQSLMLISVTTIVCFYDAVYQEQLLQTKTMSEQDEVTRLYSRQGVSILMPQLIKAARREKKSIAFIYADLDKFKEINDRYGHYEGDEAIKAAAHILRESVREVDLLARIKGDEFLVAGLVEHEGDAHLCAQRIIVNTLHQNEKGIKPYTLQMTLGIIVKSASECANIDVVLLEAREQMYKNKQEV